MINDADGEIPVAKPAPLPVTDHYNEMHSACGRILEESFSAPERVSLQGQSHQFLAELEDWVQVIGSRPEAILIERAAHEYQFALLALAQGHYRHAFKGLRLVLELILQTVHLSAHTIDLLEWLDGRKDTVWSALVSDGGVLSPRYSNVFFAEMKDQVQHFRAIAKKLYRECSETVHGNIPKLIPTPQKLEFSQESFNLWHEKAELLALTTTFVLTMRYLLHIPRDDALKLETALICRLGHISAVRNYFGVEGGE